MKHAAFLRGLNVGGHRVKMAHLRDLLAGAGFTGVETLLASGNVVFEAMTDPAAQVESRIEEVLEGDLGYAVPTFLRSVDEVSAVVDGPFSAEELEGPDYAHYVLFLKSPIDDEVRRIFEALQSDRDVFRYGPREVHWLSRGRISESPLFGGPFEKATRGVPNTMRKATTLRRLVAKYGG